MVVNTEVAVASREVVNTGRKITINKAELPWLPTQTQEVPLVGIRFGGSELLFGSTISNKALIEAASSLNPRNSEIANNLLYTHLSQYAEGRLPHAKFMDDSKSSKPVFYIGNKSGIRVYFMRFGKIEDKPVVIKVAVCDKSRQLEVLEQLTTNDRKRLKAAYGVS